jgi:effector-binding domain-containing protein
MKIIDAIPNKSMTQEMQFADFPVCDVNWLLQPIEDGSTIVTWTIDGKDLPFLFKAYTTVMGGMEQLIGPHFERGLELLDNLLIEEMKVYTISIDGVTQHSGGFYLYNTTSCKMEDFKEKMQLMFPEIKSYALANNIQIAGSPFVIYHKWDDANNAVMFSCAVPTSSRFETTDPDILTGQLESFKAVKTVLKGDYKNLKEAWDKTMAYIQTNNLEFSETGPMIESYITDSNNHPNPADWNTELFIAIK